MMNKIPTKHLCCLVFVLLSYTSTAIGSDSSVQKEESFEPSISSDSNVLLSKLFMSLGTSRYWAHVSNNKSITCKYYSHEIKISDLMALLKFKEEDLVKISNKNIEKYDDKSMYWKSCNRVWYFGDGKVDQELSWFNPDFVLDETLAIALVKTLDKENSTVRVVVISKKNQILANRKQGESIWDVIRKVYHSVVYSHPEVKQYKLTEDEKEVLGEAEEKE
jgi:hypothetical protein